MKLPGHSRRDIAVVVLGLTLAVLGFSAPWWLGPLLGWEDRDTTAQLLMASGALAAAVFTGMAAYFAYRAYRETRCEADLLQEQIDDALASALLGGVAWLCEGAGRRDLFVRRSYAQRTQSGPHGE